MMKPKRFPHRRAFTLLELVLVVGLMAVISALIIPNFVGEVKGKELVNSANRLRSMLTMVRAHASFDGKRYRIRFARENEDEKDAAGGKQQPLIEREDDPIDAPEEYALVLEPWAIGRTFLGQIWCAEVRVGRPTIARLQERRNRVADMMEEQREDFEPERLPFLVEPDGTSNWVTFVLTDAPKDTSLEDLEDHKRIQVILEGQTGLAWLQRPFFEEELDLFEEKGWPAVLRQDFLSPHILGEDDVLELRELRVGVPPDKVDLQGVTAEP